MIEVPDGSVQLADHFLDKAGALNFTLAGICILLAGVVGYLFRELMKQRKNADIRAEKLAAQKVADHHTICEKEVADLKASHIRDVYALKDAQARDLHQLAERFADLLATVPSIMDRVINLLTGFREDLRRIYDNISSSSERAADSNLENVRSLTQISGVLTAFPSAIKLMVRELLSENNNAPSSRKTDTTSV